jgi:hypothetical protein
MEVCERVFDVGGEIVGEENREIALVLEQLPSSLG